MVTVKYNDDELISPFSFNNKGITNKAMVTCALQWGKPKNTTFSHIAWMEIRNYDMTNISLNKLNRW